MVTDAEDGGSAVYAGDAFDAIATLEQPSFEDSHERALDVLKKYVSKTAENDGKIIVKLSEGEGGLVNVESSFGSRGAQVWENSPAGSVWATMMQALQEEEDLS